MNQPLQNPYLVVTAFFLDKKRADEWSEKMGTRLRLSQHRGNAGQANYATPTERIEVYPLDGDCWGVYLLKTMQGFHEPSAWTQLSDQVLGESWEHLPFRQVSDMLKLQLDEALYQRVTTEFSEEVLKIVKKNGGQNLRQKFEQREQFVGITLFFAATVDSMVDDTISQAWLEQIPLRHLDKRPPVLTTTQSWGQLWLLATREGKGQFRPIVKAVLSTEPVSFVINAQRQRNIEISLHKVYYYQGVYRRASLRKETQASIEQRLNQRIKYVRADDKHASTEEIADLSSSYADLVRWITRSKQLRENIETQIENYHKNIHTFYTDVPPTPSEDTSNLLVASHRIGWMQQLAQMEADANHNAAIQKRWETLLHTISTVSQLRIASKERMRDYILGVVGVGLGLLEAWGIIDEYLKQNPTAEFSTFLLALVQTGDLDAKVAQLGVWYSLLAIPTSCIIVAVTLPTIIFSIKISRLLWQTVRGTH